MASFDIYYKVYITPRADILTYGTEIDVSDRVDAKGIAAIKRQIDSTDYDMGAFKYSDVTIKGINFNGYFNDEKDKRSIFFPFSRDLAKVRVIFTNRDGDTVTFKGLINEEATKLDFKTDIISFRVLSLDSVIRSTKVSAGTITDGTLCSVALENILNVPAITSVLNFSALNINPSYDFVIDSGAALEQISTRDALNKLLLASNSIMLLDSSDNMIVTTRDENTSLDILLLYGPYDEKRRQNVIDLKDYNTGKHRMFNSFLVNETESQIPTYVEAFGFRQKQITVECITNPVTAAAVGASLVDDFKVAKIELSIDVQTSIVKDSSLLDRVSINWPLRVTPITGGFLPIVGDAKIGDTSTPLPNAFGSLVISPNTAFKIIEINHNPSTFVTSLKLRQSGRDLNDGFYNVPESTIVGFAVIGISKIGGTGTPAVTGRSVGAAVIGETGIG